MKNNLIFLTFMMILFTGSSCTENQKKNKSKYSGYWVSEEKEGQVEFHEGGGTSKFSGSKNIENGLLKPLSILKIDDNSNVYTYAEFDVNPIFLGKISDKGNLRIDSSQMDILYKSVFFNKLNFDGKIKKIISQFSLKKKKLEHNIISYEMANANKKIDNVSKKPNYFLPTTRVHVDEMIETSHKNKAELEKMFASLEGTKWVLEEVKSINTIDSNEWISTSAKNLPEYEDYETEDEDKKYLNPKTLEFLKNNQVLVNGNLTTEYDTVGNYFWVKNNHKNTSVLLVSGEMRISDDNLFILNIENFNDIKNPNVIYRLNDIVIFKRAK